MDTKDKAELRRLLGLVPDDAPVFTVPPLVGRDDGHFLAALAALLLRKGGVPARLLLPAPNRESRRILRFATSALEPTAVVVVPSAAALSMPDILAAADILIVPSQALYDPDTMALAMSARLPIVAAGLTLAESPLLDETTCLLSLTPEPLNLARAMLRIWQDKALAGALISAAAERIAPRVSGR
jgi:glycosyltransferase involved in cell wall biosynthesis